MKYCLIVYRNIKFVFKNSTILCGSECIFWSLRNMWYVFSPHHLRIFSSACFFCLLHLSPLPFFSEKTPHRGMRILRTHLHYLAPELMKIIGPWHTEYIYPFTEFTDIYAFGSVHIFSDTYIPIILVVWDKCQLKTILTVQYHVPCLSVYAADRLFHSKKETFHPS